MTDKLTVGVLGASGATGTEACRLLLRHPSVAEIVPFARKDGLLGDHHRRLWASRLRFQSPEGFADRTDLDVALLCTPTGAASQVAGQLVAAGITVIDLSADHRFPAPEELRMHHGIDHPDPTVLDLARYGLTEFARDEIRGAVLIANPGCFAITAELALVPLAHAGLLGRESTVTIFAINGMTGAGASPRWETSAVYASGALLAYGLDGHRHAPEIESVLARHGAGGTIIDMSTAHGDFPRGIHLTISVRPPGRLPDREELLDLYLTQYGQRGEGEQFVDIVTQRREGGLNHKDYGLYPTMPAVVGTNNCHIGVDVDPRIGAIKIVAVTDNLVKGAAGSAIQNMNVALGLPEASGLEGLQ